MSDGTRTAADEFREFFQANDNRPIPWHPPSGLVLWHQDIGDATLTEHAWWRFIMRCGIAPSTVTMLQDYYAGEVTRSFGRSEQVWLKARLRRQERQRHGFDGLRLFDPELKLTFIVGAAIETAPSPVVTVIWDGGRILPLSR